MQLHKTKKKWRTKKDVVKATVATLFPVEEYDYSIIARKGHAGYIYLITQHYKMQTVTHIDLEVPDQRIYVNELYEFIVFDTVLQTPLFDKIEGLGILDAVQKIYKKMSPETHLISISLAPLKLDSNESNTAE